MTGEWPAVFNDPRQNGGGAARCTYVWTNAHEADKVPCLVETPGGIAPCHTQKRKQKGSEGIMSNGPLLSLKELDDRIAITRDNIRQLIEQAAAFSGAKDEELSTDRIAQQNEELERLLKQREVLLRK